MINGPLLNTEKITKFIVRTMEPWVKFSKFDTFWGDQNVVDKDKRKFSLSRWMDVLVSASESEIFISQKQVHTRLYMVYEEHTILTDTKVVSWWLSMRNFFIKVQSEFSV